MVFQTQGAVQVPMRGPTCSSSHGNLLRPHWSLRRSGFPGGASEFCGPNASSGAPFLAGKRTSLLAGLMSGSAVAVALRLAKLRSVRRSLQVITRKAASAEESMDTLMDKESIDALVDKLLTVSASTDRGQTGTSSTKKRCDDLILELEALNPTYMPARSPLLEGGWTLVYASEDPTRCSPFFWACRQYLEGVRDPSPVSQTLFGTDELIEATFAITDNIPLTNIGIATQTFQGGRLVNQVAVGVFVTGVSQMTTTSRYAPLNDETLAVTVEKTQVLGNSLAARAMRDIEFPSGEFFGTEKAEVRMKVTYLDERLRIIRDGRREDACFVFTRKGS